MLHNSHEKMSKMKSYIYVMREQLRVTDLRQIDEDRARAIDTLGIRHTWTQPFICTNDFYVHDHLR